MRLLLAEPTRAIGELVSYICHSEGVECDIARDTESLFAYIKEENFDVLCLAPNIDADEGISVLEKIRALPNFNYIPIFLYTASSNPDLIRRALSSGATDLISKSDFDGLTYFLRRHKEEQKNIKAKILLVEDSISQQKILTSHLESVGCEVDICDCANEAFEVFKRTNYDLVITDIVLKGLFSGVALAGRIRRLESTSGDVPILAITGYDDPSREVSLFSYGVSDYLKKPVDEVKFCRQVKNLVRSFQQYKKLEKKSVALANSDKKRIQFWANLSHEIRTPLNGIIGSLQLIDEEDVKSSKRDYFAAINSSSEMLLSLINDVLDLTKAESGELKFSPKNIELKSTLQKAINVVKGIADEKKIKLTCTLAENIPEIIECDTLRFNQVLVNLLHNALKFTEKGEITVSCRLIHKDDPELKFCVSDTGIGIALDEQDKIFEKFKQANQNIEAKYGGTGIGLHITKLIVSMWSGQIGVHSRQGEGSQFWFTMPLKHGKEVVKNSGIYLTCDNPQSRNILVVDDVDMNLMIAEGMLKNMGFKVDVAFSGESALQKMSNKRYDCVLMDYNMPQMSGVETTKQFKQMSEEHKDIPVIALSAHTFDEYLEEAKAAGMVGYLEKPLELNQLVEVLNAHLV